MDAKTPWVTVREESPDRLPLFCPELHVNEGGIFCLGWGTEAPGRVTDLESAEHLWASVLNFLKLQERAANLKRWPNPLAWAHGGGAAHQAVAEQCAARLGTEFSAALLAGRLRVTRGRKGFLRLLEDDRRVYSISDATGQVATLRRPCLCGSSKVLRSCSDHAKAAAQLVRSIEETAKAERRFWKFYKDMPCCGRVAGCPLAGQITDVVKAAA